MDKNGKLEGLAHNLAEHVKKEDVTEKHLWYAIKGALNSKILISNLAEALRITEPETEKLLDKFGFSDVVAQKALHEESAVDPKDLINYKITQRAGNLSPLPDLFSIEFVPNPNSPIKISHKDRDAITNMVKSINETESSDAFLSLYREDVMEYHDNFMKEEAPKIDKYISDNFEKDSLKYILNSGIGGNEQSNHLVSKLNNEMADKKKHWTVISAPKQLRELPEDANSDNTLFMEFSRSGKTEETVKIHEYTPRETKRIVFANSGPLHELGKRDNNLVLNLPDAVAGRFGRNKTPILLAPMYVAELDTKSFWETIEYTIEKFDLSSPNNLPLLFAKFIFIYQRLNKINHIYMGCLGGKLLYSADEFTQFWNEGVNKNANDISMSRYLGFPRDSHTNIEGILSNHKTKMGIFLLQDEMFPKKLPPFGQEMIDPINKSHEGLKFGDDEKILAEANFQRFSELMPTIKINVLGELSFDHAAALGQLWADVTFCYSKMIGVDPGSSPEVKSVRDRSAEMLTQR